MAKQTGEDHLIILRLPGNAARSVNDMRSDMFRQTGAVSTQALPVMVALAQVTAQCPQAVSDSIPQAELPPLQFGSPCEAENSIIVPTSLGGLWDRWRSDITESRSAGSVVPLGAGIFAGGHDLAETFTVDDESESWKRPLTGSYAVFHVELLSMVWYSTPWYQSLDWRIEWSRRIKLRG